MNKTKQIQEFVQKHNLRFITLADGTECILSDINMKLSDWHRFAHCNHLQVRVLVKNTDVSDDWVLTPYYANDMNRLRVGNIISECFDDSYNIVSYDFKYKKIANEYLSYVTSSGASPSAIAGAIEDTEAVKKMFKNGKLGSDCPFILVLDKDYNHIITPQHPTICTFKNITLAFALFEPTEEDTRKALELMKQGKSVPCVPGMMPEDIAKIADEETKQFYRLRTFGRDPNDPEGDTYSIGKYIIFDDDDMFGYSYRESKDGKVWFWAYGHHGNIDVTDIGSEVGWQNSNEFIFEEGGSEHFVRWMALPKTQSCKHNNLITI